MQSPPNFQFSDIEAAGREKQQQNFECDVVVDTVDGLRPSIIQLVAQLDYNLYILQHLKNTEM